jgi:hypothetical protein
MKEQNYSFSHNDNKSKMRQNMDYKFLFFEWQILLQIPATITSKLPTSKKERPTSHTNRTKPLQKKTGPFSRF